MTHIYPDWLPRETFGQRVKRLRNERGWSLREVERQCGIHISNLSRIENDGDTQLSTVAMLAKAFDMTVGDLLAGADLSVLEA